MNTLFQRFIARYGRVRDAMFLERKKITLGRPSHKAAKGPQNEVTVHLGHHFWGAGNAGDDFMLAGFLMEMKRTGLSANFTCCVPSNHSELRKRFPEIQWLEYTIQSRWDCIAAADSWLGLGGTPFQNDCGDWLEHHLDMDRKMCEMLKKPMYLLATGVGNKEALNHPKYRKLIEAVQCIWARDEMSAELLARQGRDKVKPGADLANLFFSKHAGGYCPKSIGYLIHFEDRNVFNLLDLNHLTGLLGDYTHFWMVQESRQLVCSEKTLWKELPQQIKSRMQLVEPELSEFDTVSTLISWKVPEVLLSTRYHASLLAAWSGSKVIILARNDKLRGLAQQLNLPCFEANEAGRLSDAEIQAASTTAADRLQELVRLAREAVHQWAHRVCPASSSSGRTRDMGSEVPQGLGDLLG